MSTVKDLITHSNGFWGGISGHVLSCAFPRRTAKALEEPLESTGKKNHHTLRTATIFVRFDPLPMQQSHFGGQTLEPSAAIIKTFSWCSWMPHEDKSCTQSTLQTGSPGSHKNKACLMMNYLQPFLDSQGHQLPKASLLHLPLPVERLDENTSPPSDVSLILWWFKSAAAQCKNSSLGRFAYLFANT